MKGVLFGLFQKIPYDFHIIRGQQNMNFNTSPITRIFHHILIGTISGGILGIFEGLLLKNGTAVTFGMGSFIGSLLGVAAFLLAFIVSVDKFDNDTFSVLRWPFRLIVSMVTWIVLSVPFGIFGMTILFSINSANYRVVAFFLLSFGCFFVTSPIADKLVAWLSKKFSKSLPSSNSPNGAKTNLLWILGLLLYSCIIGIPIYVYNFSDIYGFVPLLGAIAFTLLYLTFFYIFHSIKLKTKYAIAMVLSLERVSTIAVAVTLTG